MPTNIVKIKNPSQLSVVAFNSENIGNSFWVRPQNNLDIACLWISWHEELPLIVSTLKGFCHIWDKDWQVKGQWEGSDNKITFLDGGGQGVGGNITVSVAADGDIQMEKA